MYHIRRTVLTLLIINLIFLVFHGTLLYVEKITNVSKPDDWQYQIEIKEREITLVDHVWDGPFYLLGLLLACELLRLMLTSGLRFSFYVTALIIGFFLYSISGPMICNITDQSYRDFGFAVGGAKDINSFRLNIAAGNLPQPSDITYEGIFYDYSFMTGSRKSSASRTRDLLFAPTWSSAVARDPLTGATGNYLAVGLESQLSRKAFARKKLNLVVVLDISGSMNSPFNQYYYGTGRPRFDMDNESAKITKLQAACSSLVTMLDQLKPDDRLGIALFNHQAHLAKPVAPLANTDLAALKRHILELEPCGATSMSDGLEFGQSMLEPFASASPDEFENRIIFMTDAMPNTDDTSESGLLDLTRTMASKRIYMTFIGMGIDFNSQMVNSITKVRGANYYAVHSPHEFKKRLGDEFACMVTPMVFDLALTINAPGCRIKRVIGSPEADMATGRIMHVKTLFPAPTDATGTRGGIILLELEKPRHDIEVTMSVSYETRSGRIEEFSDSFTFSGREPDNFDDNGIRKGILLAGYADLLKIAATGRHNRVGPAGESEDGSGWSYWERPAVALVVSGALHGDLARFRDHFLGEIAAIGDQALEKELKILDMLLKKATGNQITN